MTRRLLAALAALALVAVACGDDNGTGEPSARPTTPTTEAGVGAASAGDPDFPELGNSGYDVEHYTLDLAYDPGTEVLAGTVTIEAEATDALESFNLDFAGMEIESISVDDAEADFDRDGIELIITPEDPLADGDEFTTSVTYTGVPAPAVADSLGIEVGWVAIDSGSYVLSQPDGAHTWYPVNDHPSDKAGYSFRITVPEPFVAAANGVLTEQEPGDGQTTFVWEAPDPMASYLAQVAVGEFVIEDAGMAGDVVIRHVFAAELADRAAAAAESTPEMVEFLSERWGPYPFDAYGALVVDVPLGVALETQTLSLFGSDSCCFPGSDSIHVHELAHQWFGNAVSPARWSDIWLSEGFATYAEWMWAEHADGVPIARSAESAHRGLADAGQDRPIIDPGPDGLFDLPVYDRGGLTLYALQVAVGDDTFEEIVRTYFERFNGESATTDDFIEVAEAVSGDDLDELFEAWLAEVELPPFPEAPSAS